MEEDRVTAPEKSWSPERAEDGSPADFLIGHLEGFWAGDDESVRLATTCAIAQAHVEMGDSAEDAVDEARACMELGVDVATVLVGGQIQLVFTMLED